MLRLSPEVEARDSLSDNPLLHTHFQAQGFPQEALAGLHWALLLDFEVVETEDSCADDEQLHLGDVAADAGTRAGAEGDEGGLLARGEAGGIPAFGNELLCIWAPDLRVTMDRVAWDGDNVAGLEDVAGDLHRRNGGRNFTGETHGGGAVDAHGFPDDPLEASFVSLGLVQQIPRELTRKCP